MRAFCITSAPDVAAARQATKGRLNDHAGGVAHPGKASTRGAVARIGDSIRESLSEVANHQPGLTANRCLTGAGRCTQQLYAWRLNRLTLYLRAFGSRCRRKQGQAPAVRDSAQADALRRGGVGLRPEYALTGCGQYREKQQNCRGSAPASLLIYLLPAAMLVSPCPPQADRAFSFRGP